MLIWLGKQLLGQRDCKDALADATDEELIAEATRRLEARRQVRDVVILDSPRHVDKRNGRR